MRLTSLLALLTTSFLFSAASAHAQSAGPIDPDWVYTTPLHWVHAVPAAGIDERTSFATILVFYPEGQYAEIATGLIEHGAQHSVAPSNFDGLILRTGTWSRTDDRVIRIRSREILHSVRSPERVLCDTQGLNCNPVQHPLPGPVMTETCGLEGHSKTHLAATIHCARVSVSPARINLHLPDFQQLVSPPS